MFHSKLKGLPGHPRVSYEALDHSNKSESLRNPQSLPRNARASYLRRPCASGPPSWEAPKAQAPEPPPAKTPRKLQNILESPSALWAALEPPERPRSLRIIAVAPKICLRKQMPLCPPPLRKKKHYPNTLIILFEKCPLMGNEGFQQGPLPGGLLGMASQRQVVRNYVLMPAAYN